MSATGPTKKIFDQSDLASFRRSLAYTGLHQVLGKVIEKVRSQDVPSGYLDATLVTRDGVRAITRTKLEGPIKEDVVADSPVDSGRTPEDNHGPVFDGVIALFDKLQGLIDETPPLKGPRRFGNMACREWHEKVKANIGPWLQQVLNPADNQSELLLELKYYLENSFGSQVRLDYGTGHELSYLAFIGGLIDFKFLDYETLTGAQVLALFSKYYDLVRRLILDYNLEPAGSHGVWGLDDHFHLIYILGAAQFSTSNISPPVSQVLTGQMVNTYKSTNLYVNAIAFIFKIKLGPFNEHSPILYDIHTAVHLWSKVLQGLLKMYEVEVLGKFPVVQHFWFGEILYLWKDRQTGRELPVNPRSDDKEDSEEVGFINGTRGVNTTRSNISMTAAPWAMGRSQPKR
ncbi:Phosphotyrosyl phosphatase activator [Suhomyces tanzawaensis NRRL Y-17324]|uniref:Serine/threonine-protein phosphatase 2A activator n=1 Tax=Suhomyces tanzawaensis NRRL Y-17324 TaxID=984487 RepID=A0A1E4SCF1_9ASCO|nr:Phosphotyrosyl phosphatase activator [Suhomyces tanzawaensis NRRL Y-17324]ODV77200.1 Phosphotyrosyl phosphatase activator [Suhomyces tanzawaensis NRRL Y-17324]